MLCKETVLKNFLKFSGIRLRQSLFSIKLQTKTSNFIKKEALVQAFFCEFCKNFWNIFVVEPPRWLLLKVRLITYHERKTDFLFSSIYTKMSITYLC